MVSGLGDRGPGGIGEGEGCLVRRNGQGETGTRCDGCIWSGEKRVWSAEEWDEGQTARMDGKYFRSKDIFCSRGDGNRAGFGGLAMLLQYKLSLHKSKIKAEDVEKCTRQRLGSVLMGAC